MSDITTSGGINGLQLGNQQFTFRSLSVSGATNGIYGYVVVSCQSYECQLMCALACRTWNWGMTFMNTTIDSCTNGFYLVTGGNSSSPTGARPSFFTLTNVIIKLIHRGRKLHLGLDCFQHTDVHPHIYRPGRLLRGECGHRRTPLVTYKCTSAHSAFQNAKLTKVTST